MHYTHLSKPKPPMLAFCNNYDHLPNHGDVFKIIRVFRRQKPNAQKIIKKIFQTSIVSPKNDSAPKEVQEKAFKITKKFDKRNPEVICDDSEEQKVLKFEKDSEPIAFQPLNHKNGSIFRTKKVKTSSSSIKPNLNPYKGTRNYVQKTSEHSETSHKLQKEKPDSLKDFLFIKNIKENGLSKKSSKVHKEDLIKSST